MVVSSHFNAPFVFFSFFFLGYIYSCFVSFKGTFLAMLEAVVFIRIIGTRFFKGTSLRSHHISKHCSVIYQKCFNRVLMTVLSALCRIPQVRCDSCSGRQRSWTCPNRSPALLGSETFFSVPRQAALACYLMKEWKNKV